MRTYFKSPKGIILKWSVFRVTLADEQVIYNFSDENGEVMLPEEGSNYFDIEVIYIDGDPEFKTFFKDEEESDKKSGFSWSTFLIYFIGYGGLALALLFRIFGDDIISYYRAKNDPLRKSIERTNKDYVTYNNLIVEKVDSVRKENPFLYVYTNDKEPLSFKIRPNVDLYENPYKDKMPYFMSLQDKALAFKSFIQNEKEKGYDIWLKTTRKHIAIGNYRPQDTVTKYSVDMTYFYTEKEKEVVRKNNSRYKALNNLYKRPHIDSLQTASVILTFNELKEGRYKNAIKALLIPRINPKNKTQKVYFTFHSKNGSKEELESKIQAFTKMYFKGKQQKGYTLRKVMQQE